MDHELVVKEELVTPEIASEYLAANTRNRPLNKPYVRELSQDLEQNRWKRTHQGVAFDWNGVLLDGQHRLHAIVASGIAAKLLVTRGCDPETFDVIDAVRKRTAAQIAQMSGESKDAPRTTAMARAIRTVAYKEHRVSNAAVIAYFVEHKDTLERYLPVARKYTQAVGAAFAWADMLGWDVRGAAERLTEQLWEGPEDPMRALHRRAEAPDFKRGNGQSGVKARFDIALNCLHAVHTGRGLRVARTWQPDYAALERGSSSAARAGLASDADVEPEPHGREPPAGSLAAGTDPEDDALVEEQLAAGRQGLADATLGGLPGDGRVIKRKRTKAELDAALDEAVRAANGR